MDPLEVRALAELRAGVKMLTAQVTKLHEELGASRRRGLRILAVLFCLATVLAILGHDEHIERCIENGPNTKTEQRVCNLLFPTHDHPTRVERIDDARKRLEPATRERQLKTVDEVIRDCVLTIDAPVPVSAESISACLKLKIAEAEKAAADLPH